MEITLVSARTGTWKLLMDQFFSVPTPTQLFLKYSSSCNLSEGSPLYLLLPFSYLIAILRSLASQDLIPITNQMLTHQFFWEPRLSQGGCKLINCWYLSRGHSNQCKDEASCMSGMQRTERNLITSLTSLGALSSYL